MILEIRYPLFKVVKTLKKLDANFEEVFRGTLDECRECKKNLDSREINNLI